MTGTVCADTTTIGADPSLNNISLDNNNGMDPTVQYNGINLLANISV